MECRNCGTENQPGAKFCIECGTALSTVCPGCGNAVDPAAKFCPECGTPQRPGSAPQSDGTPTDAVGRPPGGQPSVARAPAVAERRLVSVLFADLVGFTAASEERDPEETRELLSRYFELTRRTVERYGGNVEKFIGDAVMVVWGAPVAHEDDAERAVRCGLELVDAVATLAGEDGTPLRLRAGVLTGEAAVTIGASGEGMVAGDLVNTASRLQAVAPPGAVLVGEATYQATREAIGYEAVGEQELKGKAQAVRAWRALRVVAARGGVGRSEGIEPPFVGREGELRQLKDLLDTVTEERKAWLVSVIGQPGIGKSRLIWEFQKYIDGLVQLVYWHQGRSPAYGEGITFWALGEMVRQRARIAEDDDPVTSAARLDEMVATYVDEGERAWITPRLRVLLGMGEAPPGQREELFAAWRRLFELISERGTTVLAFEDLQWADPGLVDFIESVMEWSRSRPILVIALARPELVERHRHWGAGQFNATTMRLGPLDDPQMRSLLAGIAPGLPQDAVGRIVQRAEGVPLYAVETVRMLLDSGRLRRDGDLLELVGELGELEVPTTLHALVSARLDALDPTDRSLLQDAAIMGQTFQLPALSALTGIETDELERRLIGLSRRELLTRVTDPTSPERGQFSFVQAIVREVAEETLARRDRRSRHLAAARYYETVGDDELAGVLATHYIEAYHATPPGEEAEAVGAQARLARGGAAARAADLHSHDQAVAYLEQALSITTDAGERAELLERAATSATAAERPDDAERFLTSAIEARQSAADRHGAALATARLGSVFLIAGAPERAVEELRRGIDAMEDEDDPAVPRLVAELARGNMFVMDMPAALEMVERALVGAARHHDVPTVVEALVTKGPVLDGLGRRDEGIAVLIGAVAMAERHGLHATRCRAMYNLAGRLYGDDPLGAYAIVREGLDLARRFGIGDWVRLFADNVAGAAFHHGDWDAVLRQQEEFAPGSTGMAAHMVILERGAAIEAWRGNDARAVELLAAAGRAHSGVTDVQTRMGYRWAEFDVAIAQGRYTEAYAAAIDVVELYRLTAQTAYPLAAVAAILDGDAGRLRQALAALGTARADGIVGRAWFPIMDWLNALEAVLAGDRETTISAIRVASTSVAEMRLEYMVGLLWHATVAAFGTDHPFGAEAASRARDVFERLGATAMIDQLSRIEAATPQVGRSG